MFETKHRPSRSHLDQHHFEEDRLAIFQVSEHAHHIVTGRRAPLFIGLATVELTGPSPGYELELREAGDGSLRRPRQTRNRSRRENTDGDKQNSCTVDEWFRHGKLQRIFPATVP